MPMPIGVACDVSDSRRVSALVEKCADVMGGIDILVNNAGTCLYGDTTLTPQEDFRRLMEVNYFGALNCTMAVLPLMRRLGRGLIVNVASVAAMHGVPYLGAYSASKAAMAALGQSLRAELAGQGISVMNVYPNYTRTEMFDHEKMVGGARRPRRQFDSPESVAHRIVDGIERDRRELTISAEGRALFLLRSLCPLYVEGRMKRIADELRENPEDFNAKAEAANHRAVSESGG
jgi:short-subunit dehydrogenase